MKDRLVSTKLLIKFAVVFGVALLVFILWFVFTSKPSVVGPFDVRLLSVSTLSNGVMQVSLSLSNGTPRMCNVVDDRSGNPLLTLEEQGRTRWLTRYANTGSLNLGAGSNLITTVLITNPPPRFRLLFSIYNKDAEKSIQSVKRLLPRRVGNSYLEWKRDLWNPTNPGTPWFP
jgi:hypothetical protein